MPQEHVHIDWEDKEQVQQEIDRVFAMYKHLNECAASDGNICPVCGSSRVELLDEKEHYANVIKMRHCLDCNKGYTQYLVSFEEADKWASEWRPPVVSYSVEEYPYFIYFKPGTHVCEGIGPNVFPWEK